MTESKKEPILKTGKFPFTIPTLEIIPFKPASKLINNIFQVTPDLVTPKEFYKQIDSYIKGAGFKSNIRSQREELNTDYGIISTDESQWPIQMKVLPDFEITDNITNDYNESFISGAMNGLSSDKARDLGQMFGSGLNDKLNKASNDLAATGIDMKDDGMVMKALKSLSSASGTAGSILSGGRVDIAHTWSTSSFSQTYPFSIILRVDAPDNEDQINAEFVRPLAILLNLATPQSLDNSTYKWPYLVSVSIPGLFRIKVGAITNLDITKTTEFGLAQNQRPKAIKITFNVVNLYHILLGGDFGKKDGVDRNTIANYLRPLRSKVGFEDRRINLSGLEIDDADLKFINNQGPTKPEKSAGDIDKTESADSFDNERLSQDEEAVQDNIDIQRQLAFGSLEDDSLGVKSTTTALNRIVEEQEIQGKLTSAILITNSTIQKKLIEKQNKNLELIAAEELHAANPTPGNQDKIDNINNDIAQIDLELGLLEDAKLELLFATDILFEPNGDSRTNQLKNEHKDNAFNLATKTILYAQTLDGSEPKDIRFDDLIEAQGKLIISKANVNSIDIPAEKELKQRSDELVSLRLAKNSREIDANASEKVQEQLIDKLQKKIDNELINIVNKIKNNQRILDTLEANGAMDVRNSESDSDEFVIFALRNSLIRDERVTNIEENLNTDIDNLLSAGFNSDATEVLNSWIDSDNRRITIMEFRLSNIPSAGSRSVVDEQLFVWYTDQIFIRESRISDNINKLP